MTTRFARRAANVRPSAIRDLLRHAADPELISFGGGYPDPALFPAEELREIFLELLAPGRTDALQYTLSDGMPRLRQQIATRMTASGTATDDNDVLIVQGAQQGLDLVGKLFLDEGDVVITEDPTFLGALIAFAPFEPRYVGVEMDSDGMRMDALEAALEANPRAKFIYTIPDFHNPTGISLSAERRFRLVELADRYDVVIIEDSPYRDLRYSGDALPTLRSLDVNGRVIHLGSFSKILAPGLRLGWMASSGEITAKLSLLKLAADTQCSTVNMAATSAYLERYDIEAHIAVANLAYRAKRDVMLDTLATELPDSVAFTRPDGGLFTWLTFPELFDAGRFMLERAIPEARVAYVPGGAFYPVVPRPNHARVNFSGLSEDQIVEGARRLGRLLRSE